MKLRTASLTGITSRLLEDQGNSVFANEKRVPSVFKHNPYIGAILRRVRRQRVAQATRWAKETILIAGDGAISADTDERVSVVAGRSRE
jgi:hypothetical protein